MGRLRCDWSSGTGADSARYVFPDGELVDVGVNAIKMQQAGFEIRDVENLREHYARILTHWVANLESTWEAAVDLAEEGRARSGCSTCPEASTASTTTASRSTRLSA